MYKINIHSIVDVITNSSTVIYTYQNSTKEARELIQEVLNLLGETRGIDELFYIGEFLENTEHYSEYLDDCRYDIKDCLDDYYALSDYKQRDKWITNAINDVIKGITEKPKWMTQSENKTDYDGYNYDDYNYDIALYIEAKDEKYRGIAEKMIKFLNSPGNEAKYDG